MTDRKIHPQDARQGETTGRVRVVLMVSIISAVAGLATVALVA